MTTPSYAGQVATALLWLHGYPDPTKAPQDALAIAMQLVSSSASQLRAFRAWGLPPQEAARRIEMGRWAPRQERNNQSSV